MVYAPLEDGIMPQECRLLAHQIRHTLEFRFAAKHLCCHATNGFVQSQARKRELVEILQTALVLQFTKYLSMGTNPRDRPRQ